MSGDYGRTKVLFVCLGNACRSPMAEAIARLDAYDVIEAFSAGLTPIGHLAGMTKQILLKNGYSVERLESKGISAEIWEQSDIVINMSGRPLERASIENSKVEDWEIKDPFGGHRSDYQLAFERIRLRVTELAARCRKEHAPVGSGERRAQPRMCLASPIFVNLNGTNGGVAFDVSPDGFGLSCATALPDGPLYNVRIQFPGKQCWIEVSGHVVWKSDSGTKAGIRFEGLKQEASQQIRSWISAQLSVTNFRKETGGIGEERNNLLEFPTAPHSGSATPSDYHEAFERIRLRVTELAARCRKEHAPVGSGERRAQPRMCLASPIFVNLNGTNGGVAFDVSPDGFGLSCATALPDGPLYNVRIQFPGKQCWIEVSGHVVWKSDSGTKAGIRFEGLKQEASQQIRSWISAQLSVTNFRKETGGIGEERNNLLEFPTTPHSGSADPSLATLFGVSEEGEKVSLFTPAAAPTLSLPGQPTSAATTGASFKSQLDEKGVPSSLKPARDRKFSGTMRPKWVAFVAIGVLVGLFSLSMEWLAMRRHDRSEMSASLTQERKPSSEAIQNATAPTVGAIANAPETREVNFEQRVGSVISRDYGGIPNGSVRDPKPQALPVEHATSVAGSSAADYFGEENQLPTPGTKHLPSDARGSVSSPPLNGPVQNVLGVERPTTERAFKTTNGSMGRAVARPQVPMDASRAAVGRNNLAAMGLRPLPGGIVPATSRQLEPPTTPAVILASNSATLDPKAMENLIAMAKQTAIPPSITGAIAILSDPYPSLRLPDKGTSKKHRQATSLQLGHLLSRVEPVYPEDAKEHGIQGTVKLHAIIDRHGSVENLQSMDGSPVLVAAAMNAIRQWRYSETILAGQLVETEEDIAVTFRLSNPP